jgi:hypothetical protein
MNTENVRRQMPWWLVKAELSLYVALLMAGLATTIYWTSRNYSGPQESGTDRLRADTLETAPRSAANGGFAGEIDARRSAIEARVPVVADSRALTPPSEVTQPRRR